MLSLRRRACALGCNLSPRRGWGWGYAGKLTIGAQGCAGLTLNDLIGG